jgi:glycosyltransferase involved in cell wall biosynthesis
MNWQQFAFSRWYLPQMDGVIGISKGWCEWASKQNIPNVWIPSFAEDHGIVRTEIVSRKQPFILTFIGHWVPRELPKVILRAIRICLDQGFDVRMNVLGNVGSTYRERSAVRMLEKDELLKKHVQFLGFVSDEERDSILAESDGFIILRHDNRETDRLFPTRLPEYMLTGNPVILTKTKGFGGYFEHRKDVWFVSPENNPEEIANALIHLVRNPKERMVIGKRGRNKALSDFSLEILGVNLAKFLYEINETKINKN